MQVLTINTHKKRRKCVIKYSDTATSTHTKYKINNPLLHHLTIFDKKNVQNMSPYCTIVFRFDQFRTRQKTEICSEQQNVIKCYNINTMLRRCRLFLKARSQRTRKWHDRRIINPFLDGLIYNTCRTQNNCRRDMLHHPIRCAFIQYWYGCN